MELKQKILRTFGCLLFVFFLIIGCLVYFTLTSYDQRPECLADYLRKDYGQNWQIIKDVKRYEGVQYLCDQLIGHTEKGADKYLKNIENQEFARNNSGCVTRKLKEYKMTNEYVKAQLAKFLEEDGRLSEHYPAEDIMNFKTNVIFFSCHQEARRAAIFNHHSDFSFEDATEEDMEMINYCFGNFVLSNQLLVTPVEKFAQSLSLPKKISDNCYQNIINPNIKKFKEVIKKYEFYGIDLLNKQPKLKKCYIDKFDELRIPERLIAVQVAIHLGMTEAERLAEFEHFEVIIKKLEQHLDNVCAEKFQKTELIINKKSSA